MASQDFDATQQPQDVVAALGLGWGPKYMIENADPIATLRWRMGATAPAALARAHKIEAGGHTVFRSEDPAFGLGIWLWTDDPSGCAVIVTEVPA